MATGCSVWYGHRPLKDYISKLIDAGFEYFEIALDYPFPHEIEKELGECNARLAFHAPLDILLASPRSEIFRSSMKILEKCLKVAARCEAEYFNMHIFHFTPTIVFNEVRKIVVENARKACRFAAEFGSEHGFYVCIENDRFFTHDFVCEDIKLTLDIGHLAIDSTLRMEDYRMEAIELMKKFEVLVLHIHDFDTRTLSDHIPLGKGELDLAFLKEIVRSAKYSLLEIFWADSSRKKYADIKTLKNCLDILRAVRGKLN